MKRKPLPAARHLRTVDVSTSQWMAIARATNRQNRTEGGCVADHVDGSVRLRGRWRVGGGAKRRRGVGRSVGGG